MPKREPLSRVNMWIQRDQAEAVGAVRGLSISALVRELVAQAYWEEQQKGRIASTQAE